ncbi:hypothetical protein ACQ4PT_062365 [Festuca glaucescens]
MGVRAVAGTYVVLGLSVVCFALYAISLDPTAFQQLQLQMIKEDPGHQPEQGQISCAAAAAEVMEMRANAAVLLLFGAGQALMAMAAVAGTSRAGTFLALLVSIPMAERVNAVLPGVLLIAIGRCHDNGFYHQLLVAGNVIVAVPFVLLSITGVVVVFCGKVDG